MAFHIARSVPYGTPKITFSLDKQHPIKLPYEALEIKQALPQLEVVRYPVAYDGLMLVTQRVSSSTNVISKEAFANGF
ncbi:hypothetical protein [Vibrio harveyi]|uniref:hypothetical protein n=1 Tax=Vibrio harveyi TaxID=669 RepID=UPI00247FB316|nr:hypothetical protein [Vibrio harveyi]